jgi:hypothetical protein
MTRRMIAFAAAASLLAGPALAANPKRPPQHLRLDSPERRVEEICLAAKRERGIVCTDAQREELRRQLAKRRPQHAP